MGRYSPPKRPRFFELSALGSNDRETIVTSPLVEYILHGREERDLEYKCALHWDAAPTRGKVTKGALAMANLPNGGVLVIGMNEVGQTYVAEGLDTGSRDSFTQDGVSAVVNEYASPFVELSVSHVPHEGRDFVIVQVKAFFDSPVICKKHGPEGLRRGAIYTRSRRMYETVEVPSEGEMREILDRAAEARLRIFLRTMDAVGISIAGSGVVTPDRKRFEGQLHGL